MAQSLVVTCWNIGIAGGGILGGYLLTGTGAASLAWVALALLVPTILVAEVANRHGFPGYAKRQDRARQIIGQTIAVNGGE